MANTIEATFGMNLAPLRAAASQALSIGKKLGAGFASLVSGPVAKLGALFAALGGTAMLVEGVKHAYELAGAMNDLSAQTGGSVKSLFILRQQLEDNGVAAEDLGAMMNKMQKAMGSKEGRRSLSDLGLRMKELQKLTPDQQFIQIGKAIAGIGDPAMRAQAAMELFGKSGGRLITVFSDPDFGKGSANLGHQADILEKNAEIFDAVGDRLHRIGNVMQGFFMGIAERVSGSLLPLLTKIESIDLVGIGEAFGDAIVKACDIFVGAFSDPEAALSALAAGLKIAVVQAVHLLGEALKGPVGMFIDGLSLAWDALKPVGQMMAGWVLEFTGDLLSGMGTCVEMLYSGLMFAAEKTTEFLDGAFKGLVTVFGAGLLAATSKMMEVIGKIPILGEKLGLAGYQAHGMDDYRKEIGAQLGPAFKARSFSDIAKSQSGQSGLSQWGASLKDMGKELGEAADENFAKVGPQLAEVMKKSMSVIASLFTGDTSSWNQEFKDWMAKLQQAGAQVIAKATAVPATSNVPAGYAAFAGFQTASFGGSLSTGGLTTGGLRSGALSGGGGLGKAYGLVRRGDAERRKGQAAKTSPEEAAINKLGKKMDDYWGGKGKG